MKPERIGRCKASYQSLHIKLQRENPALRSVIHIQLNGGSAATGQAVIINPYKCRISLFVDRSMLAYDFSRYAVINPPPSNQEFKPAGGKILREIIAKNNRIFFACNGQTDNMWATNSVVIAEGELFRREMPGLRSGRFIPLEGDYSFFVFDPQITGIREINFTNSQPLDTINFRNAISGPVLIRNGQRQNQRITLAVPNTKQNEVLWDPENNRAAITAVGANVRGDLIFISLAGNPELSNECLIDDIVNLFLRLNARDALLLGVSADVQQYIQLIDEDLLLAAKPRLCSSMAKQFPNGRPLANAILAEII